MGLIQSQTPMMQQFNAIKQRHMDAILFFRAGDFYEMFGDDAILASEMLGITLTTRHKGTANPIPMCGVPHHTVNQYLRKLTTQGCKVALVDQLEKPDQVPKGAIVKRGVVRLATSGTTRDVDADDTQNLYVMALNLGLPKQGVGMAMADLSTGEIRYAQFKANEADAWLDLCAIERPREVLLAWHEKPAAKALPVQAAQEKLRQKLQKELGLPLSVEHLPVIEFDESVAKTRLKNCYQVDDVTGLGVETTPLALGAMGALLGYLENTQKCTLQHFHTPKRTHTGQSLWLDETALADLEIVESRHGAPKETLFGVLNYSKTPMGGRLLKRWLRYPLLDINLIQERLNALEELIAKGERRSAIRQALVKVGDLERIVGRMALPQSGIADLVALRRTLEGVAELAPLLNPWQGIMLRSLAKNYHPLSELLIHLKDYYLESPQLKLHEGGYIADNALPELDSLRSLQADSRQVLAKMESDEQRRTGIGSLKVRYNRVFGYYFEIPRTQSHKAPQDYRRKQTLVNAERYSSTALETLEEKMLNATESIVTLEQAQFKDTCEIVNGYLRRMQETALCIAQIDVLCAMAEASVRHDYVRPQWFKDLTQSQIHIVQGRHAVLEQSNMQGEFVPNDMDLSTNNQRIILITGPNMAGKSTVMRQTALIQIMAQAGCFVPAKAADLSILRRIFTRVGAQDNLVRGQSTFMLEMSEAAHILRHATSRCLVLLDEIGRGTSTYDGISIAWSMVEHLHSRGVLTLFATHYHELSQLSSRLKCLQNYSLSAKEQDERVVFTRKLQKGSADKSYGIQVARMAGVPLQVVARAQEVLAWLLREQPLHRGHRGHRGQPLQNEEAAQNTSAALENPKTTPATPAVLIKENAENTGQLSLLGDKTRSTLGAEIEAIDLDNTTPLDAWLWLQKIQQRSKSH